MSNGILGGKEVFRLFTPEEADKNESRKRELTNLILSENAVLVVGAGSSVDLGYPTLPQLIDELEEEAECCGDTFNKDESKKKSDPLGYVEYIKSHIEKKMGCLSRYNSKIYKLFSPKDKKFTEFHVNLVKLPFKGILTTNYDDVLDNALMSLNPDSPSNRRPLLIKENMARPVSDFLLSFDFKNYPGGVAHLHGHYENCETIILSINDYFKFYGLKPEDGGSNFKERSPSWSLHRKILWSILATRRSVWIGFSMKDPFLKEMLEMVSIDLWRWGESIHFALMGISRENAEENKEYAQYLKKEYGFEVVFYEYVGEDHSTLKKLIAEIYERYSRKKERVITEERVEEAKNKETIQTQLVNEKEKKASSDWLDSINQKMEEGIKGKWK